MAQAYAAILQRRPKQMIARLQEILSKPDPAIGYFNGVLRWWLGWAQEIEGAHGEAQESWRQARTELESFRNEQPENYSLIGYLALTNAGLGDKTAALALAEQAIAAIPIQKDTLVGPLPIDILARVAAQTGEHDRALEAIEKLLSIPYAGPMSENMPLTPALSGSIQCSIRCGAIHGSKKSSPRLRKINSQKPRRASPYGLMDWALLFMAFRLDKIIACSVGMANEPISL